VSISDVGMMLGKVWQGLPALRDDDVEDMACGLTYVLGVCEDYQTALF